MKHWIWVSLVASVAACGTDSSETSSTTSAITNENGVWQNSLSTNGVWQNGVWQNGVWQNGVWQNGVWQNGVWQNGVWQNGVWQNNLPARELLHDNPYAREVLQYVYSCAMRSDQTATIDYGGANPLVLQGAVGLAPQWGELNGTCDESCQRWVTACVLARTNAYGARVSISMRAPASAPEHIRAALEVSAEEADEFDVREGGFYGNMFWMSPQSEDPRDFINKPLFYACAGPGSNIPDITRRFMSSQGNDEPPNGPIDNQGLCDPTSDPTTTGRDTACSLDVLGNVHSCINPEPNQASRPYDEVITVYIRTPLTVCGNNVCENGERTGELSECASDCRPGTWGEKFDNLQFGTSFPTFDTPAITSISAVAPDHTVALVGFLDGTTPLTVGTTAYAGTGAAWDLVLAKYSSEGQLLWLRRTGSSLLVQPSAITVAPNGDILVLGSALAADDTMWLGRFDASGTAIAGWPKRFGGNAMIRMNDAGTMARGAAMAIDASDPVDPARIVIAATYQGTAQFGTLSITSQNAAPECCAELDLFVLTLGSDGSVVSAKGHGRDGPQQLSGMGIAPNGTVYVASINGIVVRAAPADGELALFKAVPSGFATGVAASSDGVFVTGMFEAPFDFGGGVLNPRLLIRELYVTKYAHDGSYDWTALANYQAPVGSFPEANASGGHVAIDAAGNVIASGVFQTFHSTMTFGVGEWHSYGTHDMFAAAFHPSDGHVVWAKTAPMVLDSSVHSVVVDTHETGRSRLVFTGHFSGSMNLDGRFLVTDRPELPLHRSVFVGGFAMPDLTDVTGPIVGNLSQPLILQATGPTGSVGWYMPPTAEDLGLAGATVYCDPPPHSTFAIGTTIVTCTATDPLGNSTTVQFPITVRDAVGPIILGIPLTTIVPATSPSGATVNYTMPRAVDPVCTSGNTISCDPPPGSVFPVGTTTVTCTAIDCNGNRTVMTFPVTVTASAADWTGILQPINADGSSIFKLGRVIPVKFRLTGALAGMTTLQARLTLTQVSPTISGTVIEPVTVSAADTSGYFRYDAANDLYIYNLSTDNLSVGTWQLSIDFGDGVTRTVRISIRP
ncbi:MAG TPA: HYR domain-containing protein [Kofleriaceae bacterium]